MNFQRLRERVRSSEVYALDMEIAETEWRLCRLRERRARIVAREAA